MFWFAGLIGMGVESRMARKWLASSSTSCNVSQMSRDALEEPPSYRASFNPFPALVIGVTGSAMAAHAQVYLFQASFVDFVRNLCSDTKQQVQIHSLWGNLLVAFSVLRCLTYFFLWLGPPKSMLPSRPPTEALGSFFLACGGLVFMFSTEEVTLAAMRRGRDGWFTILHLSHAINRVLIVFPRCDDVLECRCCYYLFYFLLGLLHSRIQGMVEIAHGCCTPISQCLRRTRLDMKISFKA